MRMKMAKKEQIEQWGEFYGVQISEEEYQAICYNLNGFFKILCEWNKEEKETR